MLAAAAASCALAAPAGATITVLPTLTFEPGAGNTDQYGYYVENGVTVLSSDFIQPSTAPNIVNGMIVQPSGRSLGFVKLDTPKFFLLSFDVYTTVDLQFINGNNEITVKGNDGSAQRIKLTYPSGYSAAAVFREASGSYSIDNVIGATGTVPEPASWALFILGFGAIGGAMRVRKRQLQPA
jgi:hypothetical protein